MYRVVIADDEETIRNGLENLIHSYNIGLKVVAKASDGKEALDMIKKFKPSIIIMDINMPFLNGLEIIEEVNKIDPTAKTIIISGYDRFDYAQKAIELGIFNYLLKPIDIVEFKTILLDAIKTYSERIWEINNISKEKEVINSDSSSSAIKFIQQNFSDKNLSLQLVADELYLSSSYLSKLIKNKTGNNFTDYLNKLRIDKSIEMLLDKDGNYTIKYIASKVGYNSQHYFSRAFKNYVGLSPVQYRNEHLKKEKK